MSTYRRRRHGSGGVAEALGLGREPPKTPPTVPALRINQFQQQPAHDGYAASARRANINEPDEYNGRRYVALEPMVAPPHQQPPPMENTVPKGYNNATPERPKTYHAPEHQRSRANSAQEKQNAATLNHMMEMVHQLRSDLATETARRGALEHELRDYKVQIRSETQHRSQLEATLLSMSGRLREMELAGQMQGQMLKYNSKQEDMVLHSDLEKIAVHMGNLGQQTEAANQRHREAMADIRTLIRENNTLKERVSEAEVKVHQLASFSSDAKSSVRHDLQTEVTATNNKVASLERAISDLVVTTAKHQGALDDDWSKKFLLEHAEHQNSSIDRKLANIESSVRDSANDAQEKANALKAELMARVQMLEDDAEAENRQRFEGDKNITRAVKDLSNNLTDTIEDITRNLRKDMSDTRQTAAEQVRAVNDGLNQIEPMVIENREMLNAKSKQLSDLQDVVRAEIRTRIKTQKAFQKQQQELIQHQAIAMNKLQKSIDIRITMLRDNVYEKIAELEKKLAALEANLVRIETIDLREMENLRKSMKDLKIVLAKLQSSQVKHEEIDILNDKVAELEQVEKNAEHKIAEFIVKENKKIHLELVEKIDELKKATESEIQDVSDQSAQATQDAMRGLEELNQDFRNQVVSVEEEVHSTLEDLEKRMEERLNEVASDQSAKEEADRKIGELEKKVEDIADDLHSVYNVHLNTIEEESKAVKDHVEALETKIGHLRDDVANNKDRMNDNQDKAQADGDERMEDALKKIEMLEDDTKALTSHVETADGKLQEANNTIEDLQKQQTALRDELDNLRQDHSTLRDENASKKDDDEKKGATASKEAEQRIADLEAELEELREDVQKNLKTLKKQVDSKKDNNDEEKPDTVTNDQLEALKKQLDELGKDVDELIELPDDFKDLEASEEQMMHSQEAMIKDIAELRKRLDLTQQDLSEVKGYVHMGEQEVYVDPKPRRPSIPRDPSSARRPSGASTSSGKDAPLKVNYTKMNSARK